MCDAKLAVLTVLGIALFVFSLIFGVVGARTAYGFWRDVDSYRRLAVAASTADAKLAYLATYRELLGRELKPEHYGALVLKTPANRVDQNLDVLDTLLIRLREAQKMDPESFQYQQAMFQLTEHEFENSGVFSRAWMLEHGGALQYLWILWLSVVGSVLLVFGFCVFIDYLD